MTELEQFAESTKATLKDAVAAALDKKRRLGQYAVVYRDGKVMHMVSEPPVLGKWRLEESSDVDNKQSPQR